MRIVGVDIPRDKQVWVGLTYIYGIGISTALEILKDAEVDPYVRVKDISEEQTAVLRAAIEKHKVEGDLRREVALNVRRLIDIGSFRGKRHRLNLPVRGQRTKTNARTRRGVRKTVAGKKVAPSKG
jgi:small subunit ribosomal protein S13